MIGMFDQDRSGTVNFQEFCQLWRYVTDWLNCFRSFDRDNSGNIDRTELKQALTTFGYRLSDQFYAILMKRYDRDGKGNARVTQHTNEDSLKYYIEYIYS